MMRRILFLLTAFALLAGCSAAIDGEPTAAGVDFYGRDLSAEDQQKLRLAAAIREIDPCKLLDRDAIEARGQIVDWGQYSAIGTCSVRYLPPGHSPDDKEWLTVELGGVALPGPQVGSADGVPILEDSSSGPGEFTNCYRYVPLEIELPDVDSGSSDVTVTPPQAYAHIRAFVSGEDSCAVADTAAGWVIAAMKAGPPQRDADTSVPLALVDPCALVGKLPDISDWSITADPFECTFNSGETDFFVTYGMQDDGVHGDDEQQKDWAGGEFWVQTGEWPCWSTLAVGPGQPSQHSATREQRASVNILTDQCDEVEAVAAEIVEVYS